MGHTTTTRDKTMNQEEYFNEDEGIIVEITETDNLEFPYLVTQIQNQKTGYQGVFQELENAENKASELVHWSRKHYY